MQPPLQRNEVLSVATLLEGWSKVVRIVYRQLRRNGTWQLQDRDMLDRGDGVTVLLTHRTTGNVLLLRQPRIIATITGNSTGETVEACNGQMEGESALECALREVEQETGHRLATLTPVGVVYASPGASLERVHLFMGQYDASTLVSAGGGLEHEGEDIELFEASLDQAMQWVQDGTICDARTILVLRHAQVAVLHGV